MDYIENIIINKLDNVNKSATSFMDTIGSEIRLKRNRMNLTLKALTDNTCSVSYLSKIEHNKIEPNMMILRELCGRLKINDEQFEQLLNKITNFSDKDLVGISKEVYDKNIENIILSMSSSG